MILGHRKTCPEHGKIIPTGMGPGPGGQDEDSENMENSCPWYEKSMVSLLFHTWDMIFHVFCALVQSPWPWPLTSGYDFSMLWACFSMAQNHTPDMIFPCFLDFSKKEPLAGQGFDKRSRRRRLVEPQCGVAICMV